MIKVLLAIMFISSVCFASEITQNTMDSKSVYFFNGKATEKFNISQKKELDLLNKIVLEKSEIKKNFRMHTRKHR